VSHISINGSYVKRSQKTYIVSYPVTDYSQCLQDAGIIHNNLDIYGNRLINGVH